MSARSADEGRTERKPGVRHHPVRGWLVDIALGGFIGGIAGAIVAVNFVIYSGIERGYEATLPDVFRQSLPAGIVTMAILVLGPILGIVFVRRIRRRLERQRAYLPSLASSSSSRTRRNPSSWDERRGDRMTTPRAGGDLSR